MNDQIDAFFSHHVPEFTAALDALDRKIDPDALPDSDQILEDLTQAINDSLNVCNKLETELQADDPACLQRCSAAISRGDLALVRKELVVCSASWTNPVVIRATPFYSRRFTKALPNLVELGGYLDRYFLNTTLGRTVPARMWSARRFLIEELDRRRGKVSVMNVACGSCREFLGGFEPSQSRKPHSAASTTTRKRSISPSPRLNPH